MDVFHNGGLQTTGDIISLIHTDVGQPFSTVDPYKFGVRIDLAACALTAIGNAHGDYAAAGIIGWTGKDLELHIAHQVIHIGQLKGHTQVWTVGTETTHGFGPTHGWERTLELNLFGCTENNPNRSEEHTSELQSR